MTRLLEADAIARLADRDPTLFTDDPGLHASILNRLGWTRLAHEAADTLPLVMKLSSEIAHERFTDIVLLGMGGSSLAPLVMNEVLDSTEGAPRLHVLDSTAPSETHRLMAFLTPERTGFVVASKSGTTVEPLSLYAIFREWMDGALGREAAGAHFIVVTDRGTPLQQRQQQDMMRVTINAPADVGGRFSALSAFGLVPAALAGLDVTALIAHASAMEEMCRLPARSNPAAQLAAWMVDAFEVGRDKLTLVTSPRYRSLGLWVEQLVAESTGKRGIGIVPVLEDGSVHPSAYGDDRALVVVREESAADAAAHAQDARETGTPVFELLVPEPAGIGVEFVRWEHAVALAGFLLGVNPFDEPNVAEAKAATTGVLDGSVAVPAADGDIDGVAVTSAGNLVGSTLPPSLPQALAPLLDSLAEGSYLAILAYLPDSEALLGPLRTAAAAISSHRRVPVCVELGPRYLHSTGQLHKGGPATGSYLLITTRSDEDQWIPGQPFTLGALFRAQAEGDLVTLATHGRAVMRLDLADESPGAVGAAARALTSAAQ
jgi:glucose-6-phosphate isomerase